MVERKTWKERIRNDEWTFGDLIFKVHGRTSVLSYSTIPGPDTGAAMTMGVQLRTQDREREVLTDEQCETALVGKYLLLRFWGKGTEVIDVETGKSVLGRLRLAKWMY